MSNFVWPSEDGWPYPDADRETADVEGMFDDDALTLRTAPHLLDQLDPLERQVIAAHYGLDGNEARSMKQLHVDLGLPREEIRTALGTGLSKLRDQLG